MMRIMSRGATVLAVLGPLASSAATADTVVRKNGITIDARFPGGNVLVKGIEGDTVTIAPDLRGGKQWFYWCFDAAVSSPRTLRFVLPEKKHMAFIGMQGPAVSTDGGRTWRWAGTERVKGSTFSYHFTRAGRVRLSVTIPYLQSELDAFLASQKSNRHLRVGVLARTAGGRPVELLQIGRPAPGRRAVLVTGRHHACETMASFLLEGFLRAAMSETPAGRAFRSRYVLYAVPIVDKDGVQNGDQGKNRRPHDHNRDYLPQPTFPEVKAIMGLSDAKKIDMVLDFHCPTLWMDYHQVIYFPGPRDVPANNLRHVTELAKLLKKELPETAPRGCLVLLKSKRGKGHFSDYYASKPRTIMAGTLEFPFAPRGKVMDGRSCVAYGACLLNAWVKATFAE